MKIVYQTNHEGVYVGAVEADPSPLEPGVWLIPGGCVETPPPGIPQGHMAVWQNGAWSVVPRPVVPSQPEPEAEPVVRQLSFAQLLIGLVAEGWITEAEGTAWLSGTLPAPVEALIATLPEGQRFPARARAVRPSVVLRNDPLVVALGAAQGKTSQELDQFFLQHNTA